MDCYTLDGVELTLTEFLADNSDLDPKDVDAVRNLQPGEEMEFGGGAAVLFVLRREAAGAHRRMESAPTRPFTFTSG